MVTLVVGIDAYISLGFSSATAFKEVDCGICVVCNRCISCSDRVVTIRSERSTTRNDGSSLGQTASSDCDIGGDAGLSSYNVSNDLAPCNVCPRRWVDSSTGDVFEGTKSLK